MGLHLALKPGQSVLLSDGMRICVKEISADLSEVKLVFEGPREIKISRCEWKPELKPKIRVWRKDE